MPAPPPLILASTSTARRAVLAAAGLRFETASPGVDEDTAKTALLARGADAQGIAEALAEAKALSVSRARPDALVIGADQTLACEGRLFDKPRDAAEARGHLEALRGRTHALFSAVCVAEGGAVQWRRVETARLAMRGFDDAFLDRYLARAGDSVTTSVGAYRLEGLGAHLFERVEGDHFTVLGLPLFGLLSFLAGRGIGLA